VNEVRVSVQFEWMFVCLFVWKCLRMLNSVALCFYEHSSEWEVKLHFNTVSDYIK